MDKRTRAGKIYEAGLEALEGTISPEGAQLLIAFAAMIDHATKKTPKKKSTTPLLYNENDIITALDQDLSVTRHGILNRKLVAIATQLRPDDPEALSAWFRDEMLPWLNSKNVTFTYTMLCKNFESWLEKARKHAPVTVEETNAWR